MLPVEKDPQDPLCSTPAFNSICADPSLNASSKTFDSYHKYPPLTADKAEAIETLWKAKSIQEVWQNRSGLHLIDSAANFFERIRNIAKDDFLPSHFDILKTRIRTLASEEYFSMQSKRLQIFDLGGQRGKRVVVAKNVHAIIFLAAT